jgi:hypothetical protein
VVEAFSRSVDRQLSWQRNNQNYILGRPETTDGMANGDTVNEYGDVQRFTQSVDNERDQSTLTNATYLSESITGSPRHLKNLALDSLAIVSEYGKPTVFITLTTNELWPEIQERLLPGQTAFDAFWVVNIVFKAKLRAFLFNLKHGKYFGNRKTSYLLSVIEYQARGLPHAHIVARLQDSPVHTDADACSAFIDSYISAQMPSETDTCILRFS